MKNLPFCFFAFVAALFISCSDNPVNNNQTQPIIPIDQPNPRYNSSKVKDLDFSLTETVIQKIPKNPASVPNDVYEFGKKAHKFRQDTLPSYTGIQIWMQSVPIKKGDTGSIEIDYIALIETDPWTSLKKIVDVINYRDIERMLTTNEGGNFSRWYIDNSFKPMDNGTIKDGNLKINFQAKDSNIVSHFWMNSTAKYSRAFDKKYSAAVRMRSSGSVATQIGCDLYLSEKADHPNNCELFHSDWFIAPDNFITVLTPE